MRPLRPWVFDGVTRSHSACSHKTLSGLGLGPEAESPGSESEFQAKFHVAGGPQLIGH